jgi:hypothetical protein
MANEAYSRSAAKTEYELVCMDFQYIFTYPTTILYEQTQLSYVSVANFTVITMEFHSLMFIATHYYNFHEIRSVKPRFKYCR